MEGLQPFRDVPAKLTQQLKRSFVATRTLVQGLHSGHEVVKRLKTVRLPPPTDGCAAPRCSALGGFLWGPV